MGVDGAGQTVMSVRLLGYTSRTEILCRKHASRSHNPHKSVEFWFSSNLSPSSVIIYELREGRLTTQASRESAKALEVDTSSAIPFLFIKISCSTSKLVFGGGECLLSTAVAGKTSWIFLATQILASSMNSSTRLFVSRSFFCSTLMGSADSDEARWILSSGEERERAPAHIRAAFSLMARWLRRRIEFVSWSFIDLHVNVSVTVWVIT